mgnify:FL=1
MRNKLLLTAAIIVGAVFLRLYNLNSLPIFADESIYVRWAQVMRAEPSLRFLPLSDGKQPFYMWLMIPALKLFTDPLLAGRTLSALAGLGTMAGTALAAWLVFKNHRAVFLAAAISTTLPFLVFFDRMALVDSLLTMFFIWTFNFAWVSITYSRWDSAMLAGFTAGMAWLTKSPAIFALMLLPSLLLLIPKIFSKKFLFSIFYLLSSIFIAFSMYQILRLGPEFQMIALRNKDYVFPLWEVLFRHPLDPLKPHLIDVFNFYLYLLTPIGLLLAIWGIAAGQLSHWRTRVILVLWALAPVFAQAAIAKTFTARYILFSVPFVILLMVHALEHIGQHTKKHFLSFAAAGLLIVSSLILDILFLTRPQSAPMHRNERSGYLEGWTAGHGLKEVSQYLRQAAKSGPVLVGSEGFFGTPFNALQLYLNDVPNVRVIGVGVWIDSVHEKLQNSLVDNQVFLVVNSTRFHANPNDLGLKLIASYPKAIRPGGSQEYLLFFEVPKTK